MVFIVPLVLLGIAVLAVTGYRDLRVIFVAQICAVLANLLVPFAPFGVAITSQRVVALVAVAVCGGLFLQQRLGAPRPTLGQAAFMVTLGGVAVIHALHMLASPRTVPVSGLLSAILNVALFGLVSILIHGIPRERRQELFERWLPWAVSVVMVIAIAVWAYGMLSRPDLDLSRLHQGYRLRNVEGRSIVNVWGASLVLAVPFVWQSLFVQARSVRKLVALSAVATLTVAIILTYSRAALFGLVVLLAVAAGLASAGVLGGARGGADRSHHPFLRSILGAVAGVVGLGLVMRLAGLPIFEWVVDRVQPVLAGTDPSLLKRIDRFDTAKQLLGGLPLFGYGPGSQAVRHLPENTLIFSTLYYGPLALAGVVAMLVLIGRELMKWWWPRRFQPYAATWPAAYAAYVFLLMTNDFLFFSMGTILLGSMTALLAEDARSAPRGPDRRTDGSC